MSGNQTYLGIIVIQIQFDSVLLTTSRYFSIPLAYFGVFSYCSADYYFFVIICRLGTFFKLLSTASYYSVNGFSQLYLHMADTLSAL